MTARCCGCGNGRTVLIVSGPLARCGGRVWDLSVDGLDGVRGTGDVRGTGIDGSDRPTSNRYGIALNGQCYWFSVSCCYSHLEEAGLTFKREIPKGRGPRDIDVVDGTRVQTTVGVS